MKIQERKRVSRPNSKSKGLSTDVNNHTGNSIEEQEEKAGKEKEGEKEGEEAEEEEEEEKEEEEEGKERKQKERRKAEVNHFTTLPHSITRSSFLSGTQPSAWLPADVSLISSPLLRLSPLHDSLSISPSLSHFPSPSPSDSLLHFPSFPPPPSLSPCQDSSSSSSS